MSQRQILVFRLLLLVFLSLVGLLLPHRSLFPAIPINQLLSINNSRPHIQSVFIQPEDKNTFLIEKIQNAQESIYLSIYILTDPEIINALIQAHQKGIIVKIILEDSPFGRANLNESVREKLINAGISVVTPPKRFSLLHQKTFIIDEKEIVHLTFNLTKTAFSKNRGFAVIDTSLEGVSEVVNLFNADWKGILYTPKIPYLVVSPDNSRDKIESLIASTQNQLLIACEVMQDTEIIKHLKQISQKTNVLILLADPDKVSVNRQTAEKLKMPNIQVRFMINPFLHAKYIVADNQYAYLGSVNLTAPSLDQNRELGILTDDKQLIQTLETTFKNDWENSIEFK